MAVHYEGNLSFDLGNLSAYDISSIEPSDILKVTMENCQKLIQKIQTLQKEENDEGDFYLLPNPELKVPRAKRPPSPRPMTKWEKFRVSKGLGRRKKRSRLVYEESTEGYVPRYGAYSIKKLKAKQNAIVEEKNGENPLVKQAETKTLQKFEQKKREMQNKFVSEGKKTKKDIDKKLEIAKSSTAKLDILPKKRIVPRAHTSVQDEKKHNLALLDEVSKKRKTKE